MEWSVVISHYAPMAPTLVREPFHRDGWVFEEKVDGWRMLAFKDRARVRLVSRLKALEAPGLLEIGTWSTRGCAPSRFVTGATFSARRREVGGAGAMTRALAMA